MTNIQTAKTAELVIGELLDSQANKNENINQALELLQTLQDKFKALKDEQAQVQENSKTLQEENDVIKKKFANLLDQFQEYVN